ncbi:unnamed protein product, partial [Urochloa humidicola]
PLLCRFSSSWTTAAMACNRSAIVQVPPIFPQILGAPRRPPRPRGGGSTWGRRLPSVPYSVASSSSQRRRPRRLPLHPLLCSPCPPPPVVLRLHLPRVSSKLSPDPPPRCPPPDKIDRLYIERATGIVAANDAVVPFPASPLLFGSIRASMNLGATPPRKIKNARYYQALQEDMLHKLMSQCHGPSQ